MKNLVWLLMLLVCFLPLVDAGTIDPQVSQEKYITYGKDFFYIGIFKCHIEEGISSCSAVAIDDHHILTAAHAISEESICTVSFINKNYVLSEIFIHHEYDSKTYGKADIAIGYSEKPFNLGWYPSLYEKNDEKDKLCCISGYGFTGTFNSGAETNDGLRRAGSNFVDYIELDLLVCSATKRSQPKHTTLEFLIAAGDSGGGLFIDNHLAGINSCVFSSTNKTIKSKYGDYSGHTRISKFIPWINKVRKTKQIP